MLLQSVDFLSDGETLHFKMTNACEKAEKEFITAKESLFLKSERKDQLTAHLANIIQLNEERKAKKLTELMEELNIPVS